MVVASPFGELLLRHGRHDQWRATWRALLNDDEREMWDWLVTRRRDDRVLNDLGRRIGRLLGGDTDIDLRDVPTPNGSPFHRACWNACRKIRRGQTISYAELTRRAGSPMAMRAAGQAMRSNPLPIVVPCHRVVASDGTLGGYSGTRDELHPALAIKRGLLALEGV
jgi:methylated-DNA-[protein]-cysteine S-methyltransferase